jgi:hypothetical protein
MAYRLASAFMLSEQNTTASDRLLKEYNQLKGELLFKQPIGNEPIIDYYGLGKW